METKICKQCGERKPIEQYRKYYGGRKGTYNTCKLCEKINTRVKYLRRKGDTMTDAEQQELAKIYALYNLQRAAGLQPPNTETHTPLVDSVDSMLSKLSAVQQHGKPLELSKWLDEPLTKVPEYYLDVVYEELKAKYRPVIKLNDELQPVYDDTYRDELEQILDRFYEYEVDYYDAEE